MFSDGGTSWTGSLSVAFDANNEPYTAFDYVELSRIRISVPEPASIALLGVAGIALLRRRRRSA